MVSVGDYEDALLCQAMPHKTIAFRRQKPLCFDVCSLTYNRNTTHNIPQNDFEMMNAYVLDLPSTGAPTKTPTDTPTDTPTTIPTPIPTSTPTTPKPTEKPTTGLPTAAPTPCRCAVNKYCDPAQVAQGKSSCTACPGE